MFKKRLPPELKENSNAGNNFNSNIYYLDELWSELKIVFEIELLLQHRKSDQKFEIWIHKLLFRKH